MPRPVFNHVEQKDMFRVECPTVLFDGPISRVEVKGKRWYQDDETPHFAVPSVTTILDSVKNPALDRWRKKVGKEEAERISQAAKNQGTSLHSAIEAYLKNEPNFPEDTPHNVIDLFRKIQPILNRISNIQFLEKPMICQTHAGTSDCIACFDNEGALIDFKQSKRKVLDETLGKYIIQTSAYQELWFERYPNWFQEVKSVYVPLKRVIIVATEDEPKADCFVSKLEIDPDSFNLITEDDSYMNAWRNLRDQFWNETRNDF